MSHSEAVWHQNKQTQNSLYQQLLLVAPWFTMSRHSRKLYKYLIWQVFTPDAHPDATPKRCASPPGIKHGIFCLLSKCVNYYTMEPRVHLTRHEMLCYCQLESLTSPFKAHSAVPFSVATADAHNVYIFFTAWIALMSCLWLYKLLKLIALFVTHLASVNTFHIQHVYD